MIEAWSENLRSFLDSVAAKTPTPGGGAVAGAAAALATAMARMVAEYSTGQSANPMAKSAVEELIPHFQRADVLIRGLVDEDAMAYSELSRSSRDAKEDPGVSGELETALGVAIAVPMEIAAAACETLSLLERLLPNANRRLTSDLGVAAVLAESAVRASAHMVYVNAEALDDAETRQKAEHQVDVLINKGGAALTRIETALEQQF